MVRGLYGYSDPQIQSWVHIFLKLVSAATDDLKKEIFTLEFNVHKHENFLRKKNFFFLRSGIGRIPAGLVIEESMIVLTFFLA